MVNTIKKSEIPSIPIVKFKFKLGNQKNVVINWNEAVDFSKNPHKIREKLKEKQEIFKATIFNSFVLLKGINNKNK